MLIARRPANKVEYLTQSLKDAATAARSGTRIHHARVSFVDRHTVLGEFGSVRMARSFKGFDAGEPEFFDVESGLDSSGHGVVDGAVSAQS